MKCNAPFDYLQENPILCVTLRAFCEVKRRSFLGGEGESGDRYSCES
ncbi:MAG: hypothetical protein JGK03_30985 [Microcoleus sp. PH2017_25_DOB_D_A]|nr:MULTISPECIES: hypothetical protein [unclassified Microcoleus]MCC3526228.1 hypothetical protein [Microcoleus sp. PH2017_20_SFW_D_A]MCC3538508.1 hypothetical protein [Microcoleus sp. PH2017_25_DOB_D_A]